MNEIRIKCDICEKKRLVKDFPDEQRYLKHLSITACNHCTDIHRRWKSVIARTRYREVPEYRERMKELADKFREENPEIIKERSRKAYLKRKAKREAEKKSKKEADELLIKEQQEKKKLLKKLKQE